MQIKIDVSIWYGDWRSSIIMILVTPWLSASVNFCYFPAERHWDHETGKPPVRKGNGWWHQATTRISVNSSSPKSCGHVCWKDIFFNVTESLGEYISNEPKPEPAQVFYTIKMQLIPYNMHWVVWFGLWCFWYKHYILQNWIFVPVYPCVAIGALTSFCLWSTLN